MSASLASQTSGGRSTRHAAIANYAEPPSDEEALANEFDDAEDWEEMSEEEEEENDEGYDSFSGSTKSDDEDDEDDLDFSAGRGVKRVIEDRRSLRSGRRSKRQRRDSFVSRVAPSPVSRRSTKQSPTKTSSSHRTPNGKSKSPVSSPQKGTGKSVIKISEEKSLEKKSPEKKIPWDTLPYMIMVKIFEYASEPLDNVQSTRWLVNACLINSNFTEAAVRALYKSPPLLTAKMAHGLFNMLTRKRVTPMFSYHHKIATLSIDVMLINKRYKSRALPFGELARQCPRLAHINLTHEMDYMGHMEYSDFMNFVYSPSLFEELGVDLSLLSPPLYYRNPDDDNNSAAVSRPASASDSLDFPTTGDDAPVTVTRKGSFGVSPELIIDEPKRITRLKSFRWNYKMFPHKWNYGVLHELHQTPTFAGLTKLTLVNFEEWPSQSAFHTDYRNTQPKPEKADWARELSDRLAASIALLYDLKHLVFKRCSVLQANLLQMLPRNLEHLEIISCDDFTALDLTLFLESHGRNLRSLNLSHNTKLSLSFLSVLGSACPKLEELRMHRTNWRRALEDDSLKDERPFGADNAPLWPASIHTIEVDIERKYDKVPAEFLFQSLIDSAPQLPNLRVLKIGATLDIPWRDRSEMREKWVAKFNRVFKRRVAPPQPANTKEYFKCASRSNGNGKEALKEKPLPNNSRPTRRSARIPAVPSVDLSSAGPSLSSSLDRIASRKSISYREVDTDQDEDEDEDVEMGGDDEEEKEEERVFVREHTCSDVQRESEPVLEPFVHGLCEVVEVQFGNSKPVARVMTMADFNDTESEATDTEFEDDDSDSE